MPRLVVGGQSLGRVQEPSKSNVQAIVLFLNDVTTHLIITSGLNLTDKLYQYLRLQIGYTY